MATAHCCVVVKLRAHADERPADTGPAPHVVRTDARAMVTAAGMAVSAGLVEHGAWRIEALLDVVRCCTWRAVQGRAGNAR